MPADDSKQRGFSLKRWSQRKLDAARDVSTAPLPAAPPPAMDPTPPAAAASASLSNAAIIPDQAPLPPIESLSIDSDFTAFMQPKVDEALKRRALKQLFRDPRFNVMDGLDTYIDDYTKFTPIEPSIARGLVQARGIFFPTATRVNAQGIVEEVPADEAALSTATSDALPPPTPQDGASALPATEPEASMAAPMSRLSTDDTAPAANGTPTDDAVIAKPSPR